MIYIECDPDEILVKKLGLTRKQFIHEGGKYELCKRLQKMTNSIGLIEYDGGKSDPLYLQNFKHVESNHNISVFIEKRTGNKLIILRDTLEDWIIKICETSRVNISKFGLSNSRNQLHREINSKLDKFQNLLDNLLEQKNEALLYLQSVLKK